MLNYLKGIQCADSAIMLKPGINNYFKVLVINDNNHNITIMKNTVIGNLEYLTSIVPLKVWANTSDPTGIGSSARQK